MFYYLIRICHYLNSLMISYPRDVRRCEREKEMCIVEQPRKQIINK